jgi:hypothetical protein
MTTTHMNLEQRNRVTTMAGSHKSNHSKGLLMRQLQLVAHGEPSDVIKLNTVSEPALGQEDVLISMERPRLIHRTFCSSAASTASGRRSHPRWVRRV